MSEGGLQLREQQQKAKFRARKLDNTRMIRIYRWDELMEEDEDGGTALTRAPGSIATGVDKEEEEEHHLQAALTTALVVPKDQQYVIPTPDAQPIIADYDLLYPSTFKLSKSYLKAVMPRSTFFRDEETPVPDPSAAPPHYDADQVDVDFFKAVADVDDYALLCFEAVMAWAEGTAVRLSEPAVTLDSAARSLPWLQKAEFPLQRVLEHWQKRHREGALCGRLPHLKHEDLGKIGADPYVCFRRRELRQQRKTRRSDAQCLDRIRKLRYELETMAAAMSIAVRRDQWRADAIRAEGDIFGAYLQIDTIRAEHPEVQLPTLPPFKTVIAPPVQQLLREQHLQKQQRERAEKQMLKSQEAQRKKASRGRKKTDSAAIADAKEQLRISLPAAAFKSLKYSRPYYPVEMLKVLQRDMEQIEQGTDPAYEDLLPRMARADGYFTDGDALYYRRAAEDLPVRSSAAPDQQLIRVRRGRAGRLLLDLAPEHAGAIKGQPLDTIKAIDDRKLLSQQLQLLSLRECAQLNNQSVGNYNHHYIQTTVHLTRPYTFFGWLTATSALQAAGKQRAGGTGSGSGSRSGSPKKQHQKAGPSSAASGSSQQPSQKQPDQREPPKEGSQALNSSQGGPLVSNITVKVKRTSTNSLLSTPGPSSSQGKPFSPGSQGGQRDVSPSAATTTTTSSNAKMFTPAGLSPGD